VLFTSSASGDPEVYLSSLDGGVPTQLTAFHLEDFGAVASPDGARFAFVSNREGSDRIFVQGLDGRNVSRLLAEKRAPDELESDPIWMPDGKSVLVTIRSKQQSRIARVDVATHRTLWTTRATDADQLPRPSPDGRFIAFVSDRRGNADVFVMRGNGTGAEPLTHHASAEYGPRWFVRSAPRRH
jgi:Tol biopolymer transport system component